MRNAKPRWPLSTQSVSPRRARDGAGSLSLGEQRRLEIARAIVSLPTVILLDEPVSGVSIEEAAGLRELLLIINRELGIGMVVIEHNISFLVSLCDANLGHERRLYHRGRRPRCCRQ